MAEEPGINIGGDENDINYRYKMPPLLTKIEGRGNGIKTVILNMVEVAKALHTEPQYPTKFFGIEVGAVSQWEKKRDVAIVNGKHDKKDLQISLKKFVRQFILCPKCGLPELTHKVNQDKALLLAKCASCGFKGRLPATHKVRTYIINHPPKKRKKMKKSSGNVTTKSGKTPKKKNNNIEGKNDEVKVNLDALGGDNDEVWSVDVTDEAVAKRKQEELQKIGNKSKANKNAVDDTKSVNVKNDKNVDKGAAYVLRRYINEDDRNTLEIIDEIKRIKLSRNLDMKKAIQITFDALCVYTTCDNFIKCLEKYSKIFSWFTASDINREGSSLLFIGVLEEIIAKRNRDEFLRRTYKILCSLYENDVLTKEQILQWNNTATDQAVIVDKDDAEAIRVKAKPFIMYLENDDDDDDDADDGDDGDDGDDDDDATDDDDDE